jgi:flagellar hook-length control protein FliK
MSHDMMQALSGSSLMSLSVGTLPAVKSGMMLDANPFASQLALMTGADGAVGAGGVAADLGDGSFAAALAGQSVGDAGPDALAAPVSAEILALPADASPSQIIEAVLKGTSAPAAKAGGATAGLADLEPFAPRSMPEAVDPDALSGEVDPGAERHAGKSGAAVASAADAIPVASPFIPPVAPPSSQPEAFAPETGHVRTATGAQPSVAGDGQPEISTPAPADATAAAPAAAAAVAQSAQIQPAGQPPRAASPAQRAIEAASQAARPAQSLGALLGLDDPTAQPVSPVRHAMMPAAGSAETVPPSWAAALNAVVPPATGQSLQELAAPLATGAAEAAPLETLMFDADFIGSVETQIARVIGGGQMVRMQISPEHLGRIDIEMLAGPERDHVRITTEHDAVRDTLIQSQVRLEQDLRNTNQRTADVTVELRQQSPGTQGGSPQQQQRGQSGQDAGSVRDALARQTAADAATDTTPAQRRLRGNVRYA